ncbi:lyase family protein [Aliiroseovarius sp. PTFE2010]|uniref:lyase family protein n=1 Tax=Aliiroseovarius sp. PTFE2010 TaxID=3417190 RepID=UPI003CF4F21A
MAASPLDSALYHKLFSHADTATLFSDSAELRAMLLVEGALAKVQGAAGVIPEVSGAFIHRASMELQVDPGGLADQVAVDGVPVPALVAAFRKAMEAPEHGQYVHWGATSQDIADTGRALRLKRVIGIWDTQLRDAIRALGTLAHSHADLPMAGRTYHQAATPISFGSYVAQWGRPLMAQLARLDAVRDATLRVSLSGAAGTNAALRGKGGDVRAGLAQALGLADPGATWHTERDGLGTLAGWAATTAGVLAKMGGDIALMTQSGRGELRLGDSGGSSTMPQKRNPVLPLTMQTLGRQVQAQAAIIQSAIEHPEQRDGAAWFAEWFAVPPLCIALSRQIEIAGALAAQIQPSHDAMAQLIDPDGLGLIYAEALTFALAAQMPRPLAQQAVKDICAEAQQTGRSVVDIAAARHADLDKSRFTPAAQMGDAPAQARAFADAARQV